MNFGSYYTTIDEHGNRTGEIYKCIGLAHDYLQSDNDMVLMCAKSMIMVMLVTQFI